MSYDRLKASCRLCLSSDTEFFIQEDNIGEKINILLAGRVITFKVFNYFVNICSIFIL